MSPAVTQRVDWEATLPLQRTKLVRYCRRLTGDADAAEDLAQETLFEAWRHLHELYDPEGLERWLAAIARNVSLRWTRRRGRELVRTAPSIATESDVSSPMDNLVADDLDLEDEIEQAELAGLLDRAMALLPPDTRRALVDRYVDDLPQAEIARRLGVHEGAIEARLQRGKLALRRALATQFVGEAADYGLIGATTDAWQATRLWCPGCGRHRLEGRFRPEAGELRLRCPGCSCPGTYYVNASIGNALRGLHTFKPAVSRVLSIIHDMFRVRASGGGVCCPRCNAWLPITRCEPFWGPDPWEAPEGLYVECRGCHITDGETWHSLTWSLPEARRFWRDHPRMRFLPEREIDVDGSPAVLTGFESLTDSARLEVVAHRDSCRVLSVDGVTRDEDTGCA